VSNKPELALCGHLATPDPYAEGVDWCRTCRIYVLLGTPGTQKVLLKTRDGFTKLIAMPGLYPPHVITLYRAGPMQVIMARLMDPNPEGAIPSVTVERVEFHYTGHQKHRLWFYEEW
jgi:hypothetical protein